MSAVRSSPDRQSAADVAAVRVTAARTPDACPSDEPVRVEVVNGSPRTVARVEVRLSTHVVPAMDRYGGEIVMARAIAPGQTAVECHPLGDVPAGASSVVLSAHAPVVIFVDEIASR